MVKVTILDKDKDLKPEMSAKVTFLEPEKKRRAAGAPTPAPSCSCRSEAVATRDGQQRRVPGARGQGRRRGRSCSAPSGEGQVIVTDGLAGGETLVVSPADGLKTASRCA